MNSLTAVIPFFNGHKTLPRLLDRIPSGLPVIVVDDHSDEPPVVDGRPNVRVIRPDHKGYFSGAVNAGCAAAGRSDVLVLNQDLDLTGDVWLSAVKDNLRTHACFGDGVFGHPAWPKGYVQGTFMAMRRDALELVGGLDAELFPLWGATADWQARVCRRGFSALPVKGIPGLVHDRDHGQRFGSAISTILEREPDRRNLFIRTPPLVSVIVPCYNYGRFLRDCVGSLVGGVTSVGVTAGQTFSAFDVWIVDDASPDAETPAIGRQVANDWMGVHFLRHETNRGCPAANNTGIRSSVAPFLTILSADDMREAGSLRWLYDVVREDPSAVPYDDMVLFGDGKRFRNWVMPEYDFNRLLVKNMMHPGIMFSRTAWESTGGYSDAMRDGREDWAFNISLGLAGYCGHHVAQPGYMYRREGQNRTLVTADTIGQSEFIHRVRQLFPAAYEGRFPVGCCGNRHVQPPRIMASSARGTSATGGLPGAKGMVQVEYIGRSAGTMTWTGAVTRTPYRFGGKRKIGYVDARDAAALYRIYEDGQYQFRPYNPPAPVVEEVQPEPEPPSVPAEATVIPVTNVAALLRPDPSGMTSAQVADLVKGCAEGRGPAADWGWMLNREKDGKKRIGVIRVLEMAMGVQDA